MNDNKLDSKNSRSRFRIDARSLGRVQWYNAWKLTAAGVEFDTKSSLLLPI